ncbi:hypothetical protein OIDMADRAFT_112461 [Oidiodendron maius Zn]|uniref:Lipid droplet-associated hydrolase n=1 Tax=Oidiodendron maius (strain Zn) TaxID=913774 RepID=A0A0C3HUG4_OIDMZ|nr:hypothetical protein OIDMADRAFT_112461 [Oidiodendron maius Zn]
MPSTISITPEHENPSASYHLIFLITGNPGLVSYYNVFLTTLHRLLSEKESDKDVFHIYGESLAGFEDNDTPSKVTGLPYSLEEQIETRMQSLKNQHIPSGPRQDQAYDSIILIGHSVGTYIILEMLQRLKRSPHLNIRAGILLFPTVTRLADSPRGLKFSPILRMSGFPRLVGFLVNTLTWLAPRSAVKAFARLMTGMEEEPLEVTTKFLTSRMGVWQALYLGKDEMENITEDKWDNDVWGVEHEDAASMVRIPKLIFYFGAADYWVANHTRDALIAARGRVREKSSSKPVMLIDENGLDHAFCTRQSETVAEKVSLWVNEIIISL